MLVTASLASQNAPLVRLAGGSLRRVAPHRSTFANISLHKTRAFQSKAGDPWFNWTFDLLLLMGEYSTPSYGDAPYWDARYEKEGPEKTFDWYQQYTALAPIFDIYTDKASKVLMVGCGNAVLSEDMIQNGYQDIWNIDISSVVVDYMKKRNSTIPQLKYDTMNVCSMGFDESAFDVVLDKGTLDAILCGNDSVENASAMLSEVCRVLKPGGKFLLITYGDPQVRMSHLQVDSLKWTVKVHALPRPGATAEVCPAWSLVPMKLRSNGRWVSSGEDLEGGNVHYIYVCTKDAS